MDTTQRTDWQRAAVTWAGLGAAAGGVAGLALTLPAILQWWAKPDFMQGALWGSVKLMALTIFAGAALGAAAGSVVMGGERKFFWTLVVAFGVIAVPLALLAGDIRRVGMPLLVAAAVLALAFGVWVLLAAALNAWRTRR